MPALYPGEDTSYLVLYGRLVALGLTHGADFTRRVTGPNAPFFELSDEAYQTWLDKHGPPAGDTASSDTASSDADANGAGSGNDEESTQDAETPAKDSDADTSESDDESPGEASTGSGSAGTGTARPQRRGGKRGRAT